MNRRISTTRDRPSKRGFGDRVPGRRSAGVESAGWGPWCAVFAVTLGLFLVGCSSNSGEADRWGVEADAEDTAVEETDGAESPPDTGEEDAPTDTGEIVCGEPDEVIESMDAAADLAPCDVYLGSFSFERGDFENLRRLPDLRVIEGTLKLTGNGPEFKSMDGLEELERVGSLKIYGQPGLRDVSALSNLQKVDNELTINQTFELPTLEGLESLHTVGDFLSITNNALETLEGLSGLERVGGDVVIGSNPNLSDDEVRSFLERIEVQGEVDNWNE